MASGEVDRCVCVNVTFREMKLRVDQFGGSVESLRDHFGCGRGCALCVPYVRAMLATGRTIFAVDDAALRMSEVAASPATPSPQRPPLYDAYGMVQREVISIPAGGDSGAAEAGASAALRVSIIRSDDSGTNRRPLVILNRGVASGEADLDFLEALATALAQAGLTAALLEPRTASLILDDFHAFTLADEVNDVLTAVHHVSGLPSVDATRMGLLGWSFGAMAAVEAAERSASIDRLCLLNASTASFIGTRMMKAQTSSNGTNHEPLPRAFVESLPTGRAESNAKASRTVTLIVHASADRFIPPEVSLEWLADLQQAKQPVERLLVARADHNFSAPPGRLACVERVVTFFAAAPAPKVGRGAVGAQR